MVHISKSYFGNLKKLPIEKCVAISQGVPAGFRGTVDKRFAPLWSMVKNHGLTPEEWKAKYFKILDKNISPEEAARVLDGKIILCWETPGKSCHRHHLIEWLTQRGIEVDSEEVGQPQRSLF